MKFERLFDLSKKTFILSFALLLLSLVLLFSASAESTAFATQSNSYDSNWDYTLFAWGCNNFGQLGLGDDSGGQLNPADRPCNANPAAATNRRAPTPMIPLPETVSGWASIYAGRYYSLAVSYEGYLYAWGRNEATQLGILDNQHRNTPTRVPFPPGVDSWDRVFGGDSHSMTLTSDGRLFSWGCSCSGELGLGWGSASAPTLVPFPPTVTGWIDIFGGHHYTLAITNDGRLFSWGLNSTGQLGIGPPWGPGSPGSVVTTPTQVILPAGAIPAQIEGGELHTMLLTTDGRLFTWGHNNMGQLGLGHTIQQNFPQEVPFPPGVSYWENIFSGMRAGFALSNTGQLFAWGENGSGNLGLYPNGREFQWGSWVHVNQHSPVAIPFPAGVDSWAQVAVAEGTGDHVLALTACGRLFTWGLNYCGQLGLDDPISGTAGHIPSRFTSTEIPAPEGYVRWTHIWAGGHHSFAIALRDVPPVVQVSHSLTKILRANEGVILPELTFNFIFTPVTVRLADSTTTPPADPPIYSVDHSLSIPNQSITIGPANYATSSTAAGVTTKTNSIDLTGLLDGMQPFPHGGIFVWNMRECGSEASDPGTGTLPPSYVEYSSARYQMRVHIDGHGAIQIVEFIIMTVDNEGQTAGSKTGDEGPVFTNIYTEQIGTGGSGGFNALEISKMIPNTPVNKLADVHTPFTFTLTLTNVALGSVGAPQIEFPLIAYRINHTTGAVIGAPVQIDSLTSSFELLHNQRLVIPQLPAGATFSVAENPGPVFTPSYRIYSGGNFVLANTGTPGNILATSGGPHFIAEQERNAVDFSNDHYFTPPMGLLIGNLPWAIVGAVLLLLILMLSSRKRRTIETLPLVY